MLFILAAWLLALFAGCVTAQSGSLVSTLALRQADPSAADCNATCTTFEIAENACNSPHCGCTIDFLQAQGNCLVCQAGDPEDQAAVQFLLDAEITQCQSEGININFQVDLPPAAAAIVQQYNVDSAILRRDQRAFLALQITGGHIGLVVVLAFAVFSRKVRRDPTFLNFCITWIFSSVVFSILLYRGTAGNTVSNSLGEVPPNRCLAQAALTEGAQVMTACSTLALVIQLWLGLRAAIHGDPTHGLHQSRLTTAVLLVAPYVFFIAFAIPSVFVGMVHITIANTSLERVIPTNFYCTVIELNPFLQAVYGVTLGLLIITVIFDALIISVLYKHWWAFRHVQTKSAVSLSILLRVMAFSIYRVVVAVAYGTVLNRPPTVSSDGSGDTLAITFGVPVWVDMLQAAIPLVGFLVLGVNNDMITALMFWRRIRRPRNGNISTVQTVNTSATTTVNTVNSTWNEKAVMEGGTKFITADV